MPVRLAVRAVIVRKDRVLLVNAYPGGQSDLWCAPGGGVEAHSGLEDNLRREVVEELGLNITVGALCLVNEFHAPDRGFHQVELFFRAQAEGEVPLGWTDSEGVVNRHIWATRSMLPGMRVKPDSLEQVAWGDGPVRMDALERIVS